MLRREWNGTCDKPATPLLLLANTTGIVGCFSAICGSGNSNSAMETKRSIGPISELLAIHFSSAAISIGSSRKNLHEWNQRVLQPNMNWTFYEGGKIQALANGAGIFSCWPHSPTWLKMCSGICSYDPDSPFPQDVFSENHLFRPLTWYFQCKKFVKFRRIFHICTRRRRKTPCGRFRWFQFDRNVEITKIQ